MIGGMRHAKTIAGQAVKVVYEGLSYLKI